MFSDKRMTLNIIDWVFKFYKRQKREIIYKKLKNNWLSNLITIYNLFYLVKNKRKSQNEFV